MLIGLIFEFVPFGKKVLLVEKLRNGCIFRSVLSGILHASSAPDRSQHNPAGGHSDLPNLHRTSVEGWCLWNCKKCAERDQQIHDPFFRAAPSHRARQCASCRSNQLLSESINNLRYLECIAQSVYWTIVLTFAYFSLRRLVTFFFFFSFYQQAKIFFKNTAYILHTDVWRYDRSNVK